MQPTPEISIDEWLRTQGPGVQLAFKLPWFLLGNWYTKAGEDPEIQFKLFRSVMQMGNSDVAAGACQYLHLIHGDNLDFPPAAREFLERSPDFAIPILRTFLGRTILAGASDRVIVIPDRLDDAEIVGGLVIMLALLVLYPKEEEQKALADMDALMDRVRYTVISQGVEECARTYLTTGGVTKRHPAYRFLSHIVEIASVTRTLPARTKAVADIFLPQPQ